MLGHHMIKTKAVLGQGLHAAFRNRVDNRTHDGDRGLNVKGSARHRPSVVRQGFAPKINDVQHEGILR